MPTERVITLTGAEMETAMIDSHKGKPRVYPQAEIDALDPATFGIGSLQRSDGVLFWNDGVSFAPLSSAKEEAALFPKVSYINIPLNSITGEAPLATHQDVIASFDAEFNGVDYPFGHVTKVTLGDPTILGNSLFAYEFSPSFWKRTFIILGGIHGTELNTHSPLRNFLTHFVANPHLYPDMSDTRLVVAPMLNPDGFRVSRGNSNTPPVDINRNFRIGGDFSSAWGDFSVGGDFYKGTSAFSEEETQAIRWMFETKYHDTFAMLDFHNFGAATVTNFAVLEQHSLSNNPSVVIARTLDNVLSSADIWYMQDKTATPNPTVVTYAQQRGVWSTGLEIGIGLTDTSTNAGMTEAVKVLANVVYAMNSLKPMVLSTREAPYLLSLQRNSSNLDIPISIDYLPLAGVSITHTPVVDSTLVGLYSGTIQPGGNDSFLFIAPEVFQGVDDESNILMEQSMVTGASGPTRRSFHGAFSRDVVAGTPMSFGVKTKTLSPNGTRRMARFGMVGLLLPKTGVSSPTFFTDAASAGNEVFEYEYEGSIPLANNSSYYSIPEVEQLVQTKVAGILVIQMEVEVDCGSLGTLFVSSESGNGLALIGNENDSSQRSMNERYVNQQSKKEIIKSIVVQQCLPSSVNAEHVDVAGTQKHKIGLRIKITSGAGQATLRKYKVRCDFIASSIGKDQMEWYKHSSLTPDQIF